MKVDLNCDMGESFGVYEIGQDEAMMPFITSANIACGFHAGDPDTMKKTAALALQNGVAIGAHPGLPDLSGFGRRSMAISAEEAYTATAYQIGALQALVQTEGGRLHHVKPHGALYNMAASDEELAFAIASAVRDVDASLLLYGLAGSRLIKAGETAGLQTASEVFADRTYTEKGLLTPRSQPNALIQNKQEAAEQAVRMILQKKVRTTSGTDVDIQADTICIHGDSPLALSFVQFIRQKLEEEGVRIQALF